jgi:type I restriction enzyme S subunit
MNSLYKTNKQLMPKDWVFTALSEISNKIHYGYTASSSEKQIGPKFLRITDIQNHRVNWSEVPYCKIDESELDKYLLEPGDLVFARTGATVGKSYLIEENIPRSIFASYLIRIKLSNLINKKYVYAFFQSSFYWNQIHQKKIGIGQPNVNGNTLSKIIIPIAPINEQKRIVSKLEELFTKLDAGIEYLKKTQILLKQYRQSVLKHAFEGKLTEKWREIHYIKLSSFSSITDKILTGRQKAVKRSKVDFSNLPELSPLWMWTTIEDLIDDSDNAIKAGPFGSSLKKNSYSSKGYKIYGQEQVIRGDPYYGDYYIDRKKYETLKSCSVKPYDILISLVGTIGKTLVLPEDAEPGIINPRLVKISFDKKLINPLFFKNYIDSPSVKEFFSIVSHGGTMKILNLRILKELPIPLPHLIEQDEILKRIDFFFSVFTQNEQAIRKALIQSINLRQNILKHAFEGKLVPQDPRDEAAEFLLQKIKQKRESNIPIIKEKSKITRKKSNDDSKQMRLM